jgi:lysophospholipase L1-like esterase
MKKYKILFQGDSITDCGRLTPAAAGFPQHGLGPGYPSIVTAQLLLENPDMEFENLNHGISGNNIYHLYSRWRNDTLEIKPDMLSLLIGVNDSAHEGRTPLCGEDPLPFETVYRALLNWCRKVNPDMRFVLLEPFLLPRNEEQMKYLPCLKKRQAALREIVREFDADFIELQSVFDEACKVRPAQFWSADGVHPSLAGHHLIAREWLKQVKF